jgi:anthranilate synthase component 1
VADSEPEYESAECRHKAGALIAAAREAARIAAQPQFGQ